jgi:hypothetical protein
MFVTGRDCWAKIQQSRPCLRLSLRSAVTTHQQTNLLCCDCFAMPIPTPQQREYYVSVLPLPSALWLNKIAILPNQDKYWCDGAQWLPYGTGVSGGGGTLDPNAPIAGLPAAFDTLSEIAAGVDSLSAFRSAVDTNADNRIDPENQETREFDFPTPVLTWNIAHNMGKRCTAILLDSVGVQFMSDVTYSDTNTMIIQHSSPTAGKAILQ